MDLKQDIRLSRMGLVALASSFWNQPDVQKKIKFFFCFDNKEENFKKLWAELETEIIGQINRKNLPSEALYAELVDVATTLGLKIFDWHRFLKRRYFFRDLDRETLYEIYAKNVYWTHNGCVDQYRIVTSWLAHPDVELLKVYSASCWFCFEDVIKELWVSVSKYFESEENNRKLFERHGSHFTAYWNCVRKNDFQNFLVDIKRLDQVFGFYNGLSSAEACMAILSVCKKNSAGVKYFFGKLSQSERNQNLVVAYVKLATLYPNIRYYTFQYSQEQMILIALFLTSRLTDEMEESLMANLNESSLAFCLVDVFAVNWPFSEFFGFIFKKFGLFLKPKEYNRCLKEVARELRHSYKISNTEKLSVLKKNFFLVFSEMPATVKTEIDIDEITEIFLDMNDLNSINWILNDIKKAENKKYSFLEFKCARLTSNFISLVEKNDRGSLLKFICDVLIPNNFEETIREEIELLYYLILKSDFDYLKALLRNCPEDKKKLYKSALNLNYMSFLFILKKEYASSRRLHECFFDVMDCNFERFYLWHFLENAIKNYVVHLWKSFRGNLKIAKKNLNNFVSWFSYFDETLSKSFRGIISSLLSNTKVHNWNKIQNDFLEDDEFESLKDMFVFFKIPEPLLDEEILNQKFENLMKENQIDIARKLLEFRFRTEEDKKLFISNFVAVRGGKCCKFFIGKYCNTDDGQEVEFRKFIDFFIRPADDIEVLKTELENWPKIYEEKFNKILNYDSSWDDWNDVLYKRESFCALDENDADFYYDKESCEMFLNLLKCIMSEKENLEINVQMNG